MTTTTSATGFVPVLSTKARAEQLLDYLGDTAQQVAESLAAASITGERDNCMTCPIANYLLRSDLHVDEVEVQADLITLHFDRGHVEHVVTPQPVLNFMAQFDSGFFRQLEVTR